MRKFGTFVAAALVLAAAAPARSAPARDVRRPVAAAPAWFTPAFAARVEAAGPAGVPLPQEANVRMSSLSFLGIRPGQQIIVTNTSDLLRADYFSLCTSNFVFTDGSQITGLAGTTRASASKQSPGAGTKGKGGGSHSASTRYIGTAGHCGGVGEKVFMIFAPLGVVYIGDIVKSTFSENRLAPDFALIAIKPVLNQWVSPSMAHVGGPTGAYTGDAIVPVLHSGHGLVIGTGGTPRAGVAYKWGTEWRFEGAIINGDSGSGAIVAGGLAAGDITHLAVDTRETVPVWNGGTSITAILGLVGSLQLATCSLPIPWPAPGCPPV